jgi:hypothetical protein
MNVMGNVLRDVRRFIQGWACHVPLQLFEQLP